MEGNMIRKRCVKHGHKWNHFGLRLPFQFCDRWFCSGERVNPYYPMDPEMRRQLEVWLAKQTIGGTNEQGR